jgi:hypothetical protein
MILIKDLPRERAADSTDMTKVNLPVSLAARETGLAIAKRIFLPVVEWRTLLEYFIYSRAS